MTETLATEWALERVEERLRDLCAHLESRIENLEDKVRELERQVYASK
jgi:hypothetical protein